MGAYKFFNPATEQWEITKSKSIIKPDGSLEYTPDDIKAIENNVEEVEGDLWSHLVDDLSKGVVHGLRLNQSNALEYFNGTEYVGIEGVTNQSVINAIGYTPVREVAGKGLSTNDYTTTEKNKLSGIATGANNYTHPSTHPASMITESTTRRFVSDSEKSTWNSKPNTDTVTTINGKTGVISKADIVALGIPASDTNTTYTEISTSEIDSGTASTSRTISGRRAKYMLDKKQDKLTISSSTTSTSTTTVANSAAVRTAMNRADAAFQSASDGKGLVANAITGKGVSTSTTAAFSTMATNIGRISTGKKWASGTVSLTYNVTTRITLDFKPSLILLRRNISYIEAGAYFWNGNSLNFNGTEANNNMNFTSVTSTGFSYKITRTVGYDDPTEFSWIAIE